MVARWQCIQLQRLRKQVQLRDGPANVLAVLFEYGQVLLLIVDAVTGLDDEPIGYCQVPVPNFSHHRLTLLIGAVSTRPPTGKCQLVR